MQKDKVLFLQVLRYLSLRSLHPFQLQWRLLVMMFQVWKKMFKVRDLSIFIKSNPVVELFMISNRFSCHSKYLYSVITSLNGSFAESEIRWPTHIQKISASLFTVHSHAAVPELDKVTANAINIFCCSWFTLKRIHSFTWLLFICWHHNTVKSTRTEIWRVITF